MPLAIRPTAQGVEWLLEHQSTPDMESVDRIALAVRNERSVSSRAPPSEVDETVRVVRFPREGPDQGGVGRRRGPWWKWKVQPYTADAVLVYAQAGSGRRASLHTDHTFAVWDGDVLVPFAKAYSGLTDDEIRQVDRFVRENTIERFGPVRSVRPTHQRATSQAEWSSASALTSTTPGGGRSSGRSGW